MPTQRPSVRSTTVVKRTAHALDRLEAIYGHQRHIPRFAPMDELVCCILSQHSADVNSFPAYTLLKERWPDWSALVVADLSDLTATIKNAGLANQKAKSILAALAAIHEALGDYTLEPLRSWPVQESLAFLKALPGVGPKTAAIVMCLAFGKHAVPVDTHVHRVSMRLGLVPEDTTADKAHALLDQTVPQGRAFQFHVALLDHGRQTCFARAPLCDSCGVRDMCLYVVAKGKKS